MRQENNSSVSASVRELVKWSEVKWSKVKSSQVKSSQVKLS